MHDFVSAIPIIVSLIILEGLLSVDNALVLAAMVTHLPEKQRVWALRAGLLGAYLLRGLSLAFVSILISNPWIKLVGGGYLIYLMCSHLGVAEDGEQDAHNGKTAGFWATVVAVELADMAFSTDNILAAVALSPKLWVVLTGVFIGILAMRFVAGIFVKLIERFPILAKIAYVLVGAIGIQLVAEHIWQFQLHEVQKFGIILGIIAAGLVYDRVKALQTLLSPIFNWLGQVMGNLSELIDSLLVPIKLPIKLIGKLFHRNKKAES